MTIKQYGGVFGRNPTFNNATIDGTLTVDQIVEKTGAAGIALDGVTLKDGNVVLADGKGIDFSATAGAGTSELFDDYEEGTWTPANNGMTVNSGTWSATGTYTKIGNVVHFTITQTGGDVSAAAGTGAISGFPFTPSVRGAVNFTNGVANLIGIALVDLNAILYNSAAITNQTAMRFTGWYQV
jgi:hypothetical protein